VSGVSTPSPAAAIATAVRANAGAAGDACEQALAAISAHNAKIGAFLHVAADAARAAAGALPGRLRDAKGPLPLAGVPVGVKDNLCTIDAPTTAASRMLEGFRPPYDALAVARLRAAGAIVVGKTNLDEFAMGGSTESGAFGPTRNPWDVSRVAGGSSGGSAAAVAAGLTPVALGSDTGGSVRQPASFCGIVGLKPTYGRVSRYGLIAYGSSLDQIGPMARTVADAALVLQVIAGRDPHDSTCAPVPVPDYLAVLSDAALKEAAGRLRVGVARECFADGLDAEHREAVTEAIRVLEKLGAKIVDISLPNLPHGVAAYYLIACAEASSNLARYDGVHYGRRAVGKLNVEQLYARSRAEGFGAETKRRIMLGTFALSAGYHDAFYEKALRVRRLIHNDFVRAYESCDVIATPVSPAPPWKLGEKSDDPLQMYLADLYTIPANLAGVPAISVPCGFTGGGLPIGLQLHAAAFAESTLLQAARLYERETRWVEARRPEVYAE
jgi:aspartyl-tRNA(Asn)/glutamyl-tRNA(Gln) amidotransferase subunit A